MCRVNLVIPTTAVDERIMRVLKSIRAKTLSDGSQVQITLVLNPYKIIEIEQLNALKQMKVDLIGSKKGLGNALRESYKSNRCDALVFLPDDLPFGFQEIDLALKFNPKKNDLLMLTKYRSFSQLSARFTLGMVFRLLTGTLFDINVSDTQSSFIASKKAVEKFSQECREEGFLITLENYLVAQRFQLRISETEAIWKENAFKRKTTLRFVDPFIMIYQLLRLKFRFMSRKF